MSEQWYEEEIAPKLKELCDLCKAHGVSFSATVEYAPGARGQTRWTAPDASLPMYLLAYLNHHGENIDGYMIEVMRHCRRNDIDWSRSMVLTKIAGKYTSVSEEARHE